MKIPDLFKNCISANLSEDFRRSLLIENLHRVRIMAVVVIIFEAVYAAIDIGAFFLKVDNRFTYSVYLVMYLLMIAVNTAYLFLTKNYEEKLRNGDRLIKRMDAGLLIYITFVMSWGSVITLMDQTLYSQITAFVINMIVCSVVYLLDNRRILIPFAISVLILALGLPFFQKSSDILVGHYVNMLVFIFISWLASRITYHSYCRNFISRGMLKQSNKQLEDEIEENRKINILLSQANEQLKKLTLLDELTGIPNRRSFRDFIDRAFEAGLNDDATLSIIMVDIDFFKQFNDCYGHEEGDKALIEIAGRLNAVVSAPSEFAVRWGGEEFVYAAFNIPQDAIAGKTAEIMAQVSSLDIRHDDSLVSSHITVSLGVSTVEITEKKDISKALRRADEALYLAKSSGRNCVKILDDTENEICS